MSKVGKKIDKSITTDNIIIDGENSTIENTSGDLTINPGSGQKAVIQEAVEIDNIRIDGNTISTTDTNGDLILDPDGTGKIVMNGDVELDVEDLTVNGQLDVDNLRLSGNSIISTDTNGDITLTPDGTGSVVLDDLSITGTEVTSTGSIDLTTTGANNIVLSTAGSANVDVDSDLIVSGTSVELDGGATTIDSSAGTLTVQSSSDIDLTPTGKVEVTSGNLEVTSGNLVLPSITIDTSNNITATDTNGSLTLNADGTGTINLSDDLVLSGTSITADGGTLTHTQDSGDYNVTVSSGDLNLTASGDVVVSGTNIELADLSINAGTIATTSGDLTLDPAGSSETRILGTLKPGSIQTLSGSLSIGTGSDVISINGSSLNIPGGTITGTGSDLNITSSGSSSNLDLTSGASGNVRVQTSLLVEDSVLGTQANDTTVYAPSDSVGLPSTYIKKITNVNASKEIGGIVAPASNSLFFVLTNGDGDTLTIKNESSSVSTAANRILTGSGQDIQLEDGASLYIYYDTDSSRWRVIGGTGGSSRTTDGTFSSPTEITAAGGVTATQGTDEDIYIDSDGGAVNVTANPQVSAGSLAGQTLRLIGTSNTDYITLEDGDGLALNGSWDSTAGSILTLLWDDDSSLWREVSRSN